MLPFVHGHTSSGGCLGCCTNCCSKQCVFCWTHKTVAFYWWESLQWRHNGADSVSNYQPHDCFLNRLFRRRSKKTSKLRLTGLCAGNSPVAGAFPAQMASNAENVSIWWRHQLLDVRYSVFNATFHCSNWHKYLRYPQYTYVCVWNYTPLRDVSALGPSMRIPDLTRYHGTLLY